MTQKIGILLTNLGTPSAPTAQAVSKYLRQFLSDPRVIDLPRWKWLPILNGLILPKRSKWVAKNYQSIWTEQGSPLLAIGRQQQILLQQYLQQQGLNIQVELAMTYGEPSMDQAVANLIQQRVKQLIVLPLYPQYSSTTTASVFDAFAKALTAHRYIPTFDFIHSYHLAPAYIQALCDSVKSLKEQDLLLFSFHGIPVRYEQEGDFYRQQCLETAQAVATKLGLTDNQWQVTFQSRFGKEQWLQPYTDEFLQQAPQQGIKHIQVICAGFATDCLETLEEIAVENRDIFLNAGGENYHYIPALNQTDRHIKLLAELVLAKIN